MLGAVTALAAVQHKQPTLHREPIINELVIPALKAMEGGGYDRNVLLWLQDGYVNKALAQNQRELGGLRVQLAEQGLSEEEIKREQMQALAKFARQTYKQEAAEGRGADVKSYIDAANTFYEAESLRYGGHLQEVAEYIEKALANGEKPDLDRLARQAYISMAKMSSAIQHLQGMNGQAEAQKVAAFMKRGIDKINFTTVADQPTQAGRQLLKLVDEISQNPKKYIEFRDPSELAMPKRQPWEFEPVQRGTASFDY